MDSRERTRTLLEVGLSDFLNECLELPGEGGMYPAVTGMGYGFHLAVPCGSRLDVLELAGMHELNVTKLDRFACVLDDGTEEHGIVSVGVLAYPVDDIILAYAHALILLDGDADTNEREGGVTAGATEAERIAADEPEGLAATVLGLLGPVWGEPDTAAGAMMALSVILGQNAQTCLLAGDYGAAYQPESHLEVVLVGLLREAGAPWLDSSGQQDMFSSHVAFRFLGQRDLVKSVGRVN